MRRKVVLGASCVCRISYQAMQVSVSLDKAARLGMCSLYSPRGMAAQVPMDLIWDVSSGVEDFFQDSSSREAVLWG